MYGPTGGDGRNLMHTRTNPESGATRERGNSLVEYVLLMALIAIVCIAALTYFGSTSQNSIGHSKECILNAGTSSIDPSCK